MTVPAASQAFLEDLCAAAPVVPVLTVPDAASAAPLARALVAGGLPALEVTLRTPAALAVIAAMRDAAPQAWVGAGTLRTPADVAEAKAAGAVFGVSPGATPALLDAAEAAELPLLPGAATASEVMALAERGLLLQKFFPAAAAGGRPLLKSLAAPLTDVRFCPTGGIDAASAPDWLALPNVICVGGSWVAPSDAVASGDWDRVEALAAEAAALRP
ncbi:MAG: bifunctional 4-hydroxy-2-oxoglutarate aldolase/2-dehydro-3-deoxy-phosphogluconate aldolase [Pseudomonadota bacterium]